MTTRQKILKRIYPLFMWWARRRGKNVKQVSNKDAIPAKSFYELTAIANNGSPFDLFQLKGKKIMLVNTASDCGYTEQYDELQALYHEHGDRLHILGFPSNDFKQQEKGSDEQIAEFCRVNFGVTFPLMKKSSVKGGSEQNPVYAWLTDPKQNGWNSQPPAWNFCKYIVNENGQLTHYFGSSVSPREVFETIEKP